MNATRRITNCSRMARLAGCAGLVMVLFAANSSAAARTAIITSSTPLAPGEVAAFSTPGDSAGAFVSLNNWIALLFSAPFATSRTDTISIFTLPPTTGRARFTIRFGVYNSGNPIFVASRSLRAGRSLNTGNLFQRGCSAFGGCDYIYIETTRTRRGASGAEIDYVSVNGQPTTATAPSPEPSQWALMIMGFLAVAMRLKQARRGKRRYSPSSAKGSLARCSR